MSSTNEDKISSFSNLKPCSHISQALKTSAKNTILKNYSCAFKVSNLNNISQLNLPIFKNTNNNNNKIDKNKIIQLKSRTPKCSICSNILGINFYCLQCLHIGCLNHQHFVNHAKQKGHIFGIDSINGGLFCFKCGDYISDFSLDLIREEQISPLKKKKEEEEEEDLKLILKYSKPSLGKSTSGIKGFINMGSTCFISCILQTLIHNPLIRDFFLTKGHSMDCFNNNNNNECITCCIEEIFKDFFTSNSGKSFGPISFLTKIWKKNKLLIGYSQQDAHEFWQFLINQLHQDLNSHKASSSSSDSNCQCIIHQTFASDLQSSIKCSKCDKITTTIDPIIDISLDIINSNSLEQSLENFIKIEKLDIKYNCNFCQEKTLATKKLSIFKFPNVLSIQLKRFEHFNQSSFKIDKFISFPFYIDMNPYSSSSSTSSDPALNYELFAIVCHIGTVNTGHYIVCIKDSQGNWWKFDDSIIIQMERSQVEKLEAYLLFYSIHKL